MYSTDGWINEKHLAGNDHHPSNVGGQQACKRSTLLKTEKYEKKQEKVNEKRV